MHEPALQHRGLISVLLFIAALPAPAEILFRLEKWEVASNQPVECADPVRLTLKGPDVIFQETNRTTLDALAAGIAAALSSHCPGAKEVILSSGRTRRLVTLPAASAAPTPPAVSRASTAPAADPPATPPAASPQPIPPPESRPASPGRGASVTRRQPARSLPQEHAPVPATQPQSLPHATPAVDLFVLKPPKKQSPQAAAKAQAARCEVYRNWMQRLAAEHPEFAREYGPQEHVNREQKFAKLLSDESFVPWFGKPYESLTSGEIEAVGMNTARLCGGPMGAGYAAEMPFGSTEWALSRMAQERLRDLTRKARHARLRLAYLRTDLAAKTQISRDMVLDVEDEMEQMRHLLWPSEVKAFEPLLRTAWTRVSPDDKGPDFFIGTEPEGFLCMGNGALGQGRLGKASEVLPGQAFTFRPYTKSEENRFRYDGSSGETIELRFTQKSVIETSGGVSTSSPLRFDGYYWLRYTPADGRIERLTLVQHTENSFMLGRLLDPPIGRCTVQLAGTISGYKPKKPILLPGEFRVRRTPLE